VSPAVSQQGLPIGGMIGGMTQDLEYMFAAMEARN
jgi:hypothetical protein